MPFSERELAYVWDMREAAREINSFMRGVRFAEFENNKVLRYAAERQLLVISEAAGHVSPQARNQHPEIPWEKFIRLRNILAHEYGESLTNRVWLASTEAVPELLASLIKYLP
jgi:uncharacterized protein with HEPN domain